MFERLEEVIFDRATGDELFPSYGLALIDADDSLMEDNDGNPLLLTDGYVSRDRTLRVLGIGRWNAGDVGALNLVAFRNLQPIAEGKGDVLSLELTEGPNAFGFLVADAFGKYIDFQYVDVWYELDELIAGRYEVIGVDGEIVRDVVTGLEWQRCAVGQTWNPSGRTCDGGMGDRFSWEEATQLTAPGGFRLPDPDELITLKYCSSGQPDGFFPETEWPPCSLDSQRPALVLEAFPIPPWDYWTSSPHPTREDLAIRISFMSGYEIDYRRSAALSARLVRGGR